MRTWISSRLSPRWQSACHLGLLLASLWFLPIRPDAAMWKPTGEEIPVGRILALLAATIGLPYFLLSSTGPLLQEDFRRETGRTPYRLYSLSNIGSLLALLSYPFLFEPQLTLRMQIVGWSWAMGCSCFSAAGVRWPLRDRRTRRALAEERAAAGQFDAARPTWRDILLWLALAACGSVMLLATTNQLCQEISSVPFLWVRAAGHVPVHVHHLLRPPALVSPRHVSGAAGGGGAAGLRGDRDGQQVGDADATGGLFGHAVGVLHGLPRRAGAGQAGAALCHAVLPDGRGRRSVGRHSGGPGRAVGAARFLGVSNRADRDDRAWRLCRCPFDRAAAFACRTRVGSSAASFASRSDCCWAWASCGNKARPARNGRSRRRAIFTACCASRRKTTFATTMVPGAS